MLLRIHFQLFIVSNSFITEDFINNIWIVFKRDSDDLADIIQVELICFQLLRCFQGYQF